jgi:ribosomal protein S27AE
VNAGINGQTYYVPAKSLVRARTNNLTQRRLRMPCPRCIGGNMFRDHDGEYICIQCGFSHYSERTSKTKPIINNEVGELMPQPSIDTINVSPK